MFISDTRYTRHRERMDLVLSGTWIWLILTIGAYFLYYILGIAQNLWLEGIWFTENDVLHIGLILWMIYIAGMVSRQVVDLPELQGSVDVTGKD